jgi:hypothetical protein
LFFAENVEMKIIQCDGDEGLLVNYWIFEAKPRIYLVAVPDQYERGMLFLRSQVFYESPSDEFRGKNFCVFDYMNFYRKNDVLGYFYYPRHWDAYNVPSDELEKCIKGLTSENMSITPYDKVMVDIVQEIRKNQPQGEFYLIGVDSSQSDKLDHELAHAFFYTDKEYREEMLKLISSIKSSIYKQIEAYLSRMGYSRKVMDDEIQAYLATGLTPFMSRIHGIKTLEKNFRRVFRNYNKTVNI